MPRTKQNPSWDPNDASCRQLLEALADGNPIPDTSTIFPDKQQLIALLVEISKGNDRSFSGHPPDNGTSRAHRARDRLKGGLSSGLPGYPWAADPYTILGVASTATSEEIKEAWLSRLTLYHPDRHPENSDWFTRQAARLNEAYQILKEPERRHAYDERRRRELRAREQSSLSAMRPVLPAPSSISPHSSRLARGRAPALIALAVTASTGLVLMALSGRSPERRQVYLATVQPVAAGALPSPPSAAGPLPVRLHVNGSPSLNLSAALPRITNRNGDVYDGCLKRPRRLRALRVSPTHPTTRWYRRPPRRTRLNWPRRSPP